MDSVNQIHSRTMCTISTPWGVFPPWHVAIDNTRVFTILPGSPFLLDKHGAANEDKCLAKGHKCRVGDRTTFALQVGYEQMYTYDHLVFVNLQASVCEMYSHWPFIYFFFL